MNTQTILSDTIREYEKLKANKALLSDALKEANARLAQAESEVIALLLDQADQTGADDLKVVVDKRSYSVSRKDYYTIPAGMRERAFPMLRDLGLGDLIQERVDDRTLTNQLNAISADNGGVLPDDLAVLPCSVYTKTTLSSRKA